MTPHDEALEAAIRAGQKRHHESDGLISEGVIAGVNAYLAALPSPETKGLVEWLKIAALTFLANDQPDSAQKCVDIADALTASAAKCAGLEAELRKAQSDKTVADACLQALRPKSSEEKIALADKFVRAQTKKEPAPR